MVRSGGDDKMLIVNKNDSSTYETFNLIASAVITDMNDSVYSVTYK